MMDFNENVKNIMSVDDSVSVKHHIGITVRVSAMSKTQSLVIGHNRIREHSPPSVNVM